MGVNKKVIGQMNDKLGGRIITEIMTLRPKLYTNKMVSGSEDKKCKGVKNCIVKKTPDFEDYRQCLLTGWNVFRKQLLFQNKLHEADMAEVIKLAISRDNNKKVIQSDGMSTLAYRHKEVLAMDVIGKSWKLPSHT